ncbi:hypothetical protein EVAR_27963_1 [Eumeta japonica]|uniref:Uncharacterized protein n=1 Tax=Eumeta variegata TaxID=151549 RepID=A0A4C1ZVP5_EUMVA|nr:hypothetical protein EVAR_27963_1 [Eumeta japonica]
MPPAPPPPSLARRDRRSERTCRGRPSPSNYRANPARGRKGFLHKHKQIQPIKVEKLELHAVIKYPFLKKFTTERVDKDLLDTPGANAPLYSKVVCCCIEFERERAHTKDDPVRVTKRWQLPKKC